MFRPAIKLFLASLALAAVCPALTNTTPKPAVPPEAPAPETQPGGMPAEPAAAGTTAVPSESAAQKSAAPEAAPAAVAGSQKINPAGKTRVLVVPIQGAIDEPTLYVLRRGLKNAIDEKINVIVLDMDTLGGRSDVTFDMMEALDKFPGTTFTLINDEAASAGAFIAGATTEIWHTPKAVVGAAAAVSSDGQEIPETMRLKLNSFFGGKLRVYSEGKGRYRAEVLRAMMDKDYEFKIGGEVIKPKGELLTLTAGQAMKEYGSPPQALFGSGIVNNIDELLSQRFGASNYEVTRLEVTWSERLAQWLGMIKPILLGLGMLALFIEFKTPGFGVFGITGIVLLAIVFLSSYVAGLSGHEPMILFTIGLLLVVAELVFFPGVVLPVIAGTILMLGSLVWAMADIWPGDPVSVAWTTDTLVSPIMNLGFGLLIGTALILALLRYMPKSWFWDRLELASEIAGAAQIAGLAPEEAATLATLLGRRARVVTPLRPFGQIEIDGKRYEARFPLGTAEVGSTVVVRGHTDFSLDVEPAETEEKA